SLSGEKEVYPELLLLWLSHGLDARGIPMPFICALISSLDGEHLAMIRPSEDISRCILKSGMYSLLDKDSLWKHIMAVAPSDDVLATIRVPWESAPPQVFRKHGEILSRILVGIPDGMLEVMYENGVPENAPYHMVKRWAFLDGVDVKSGVEELLKREMYEDVYALMKTKGIVTHALIHEVLQYADEHFISDIIMKGYGHTLVDTPIWDRLSGQQKALVLLSLDAGRRKALLASMKEDIWDILAQIDDVDVLRVLAEDVTLSAKDFLAHKEKFPLSVLGVLADRVDDIEPLFQHWPEGVYHSRRMQQQAHKFTEYLDERALVFLICSGDIPFTGNMAYLVDKMPDTCIREIKETWQYLQPQRLKSVLVSAGEDDVNLWKIVYDSGIDVQEAPLAVRYKLWKETDDCSLLSEKDILGLLDKDLSVARCMPSHLWKQFIEEKNPTYLAYMPEEVFKDLDEDDVTWILSHVPQKVDGLMKMWGRQRVMTFLAQYLPALAVEHMTEDDIPYVKDFLQGDFLKQAIEKYPHLMWREICRLEDTVHVSVSADYIDSEDMLLCLGDHGVSFSGSVQIPVRPSTMRWLYKEGLASEKSICRSLEVYGDEYVQEGYMPDRRFLSCLRTIPTPQNIHKLVSLGWWGDLPEEKQISLLENTKGLRWQDIPISENVAKVLLEKGILSPYDVAYIGYSHLLKEDDLSPHEAISLYKEKHISLHELYRLSKDAAARLNAEDIDVLLREGKYVDAPDGVIPQLSPESVYALLRHGREISYDMFPPAFVPWIATHDEKLREVIDALPERLIRNIITYMVSNGIYHDTLWRLMSYVDIDFVEDIIHTADRDMWEHIPPKELSRWLEIFVFRNTFTTILERVPVSLLKETLKLLPEDQILAMMYSLKAYAHQILMECSPAEVVSSSLKVFLPLITDTVFHEWIKAYPEETYEHIHMGALLYTVKKPCILKDISESGIRRLVEVSSDDIVFEIIRRAYAECRDVAGRIIDIYADIHSLRPSEVMLRAGLVSGS
ncbi:MAG: hypothetical protein GXO59_05230, partial [Dictyoglomi bacterium]|nr:hypothetical protein [Dictyoglomota bacterium]